MVIDYSAWREWKVCPAGWYEKYINKRQPRWPAHQRDDALCLGSLVHEGLQVWQERHVIEIPQPLVEELNPTKECYDTAMELIYGYTMAYPEERWPLIRCEQPLIFPVQLQDEICSACNFTGSHSDDENQCSICYAVWKPEILIPRIEGLAKLDAFFYVPEPTQVESGQPGLTFTLSPGWWGHEYKTKSPDISLGLFMQKWAMNMQASFQTLALQEEISRRYQGQYPSDEVQGVLVNVLEKPKRYVPRRKCKSCQEMYEYSTWLPTGTGEYSCPVCGNRQVLQALKENPSVHPPEYYRIIVTRTTGQLQKARQDILQVGQRMQQMAVGGLGSEEWNVENCIQYKRPCQYYKNHLYSIPTKEDPDMQDCRDYRGIIEEI